MVNRVLIRIFIYGFLILIIFLLIFFTCIELRHESQSIIPVVVSVKESFLCTFENEEWISKDIFTVGENVYICLTITTNKPSKGLNFWIYVFDEQNQSTKKAVFENSINFSTIKKYIPIQYEFSQGKYYIAVHYGRQVLVGLPIEIIR